MAFRPRYANKGLLGVGCGVWGVGCGVWAKGKLEELARWVAPLHR
ncbi:hypothetical protein [Moorena sp. SIO3I6]|nr:hypothetical protein [Moorena sp. SIO3I6]